MEGLLALPDNGGKLEHNLLKRKSVWNSQWEKMVNSIIVDHLPDPRSKATGADTRAEPSLCSGNPSDSESDGVCRIHFGAAS